MTLHQAIARRADATAHLTSLTDALARARETEAASIAEVDRLATEERELIARHARRLEGRALVGNKGPAPVVVAPDVLLARNTAEFTRDAAAQAAETLGAREATARKALTVAEGNERKIRADLTRAEADRIALRINEIRAEEHELCARLVALDLDSTASGSLLSPRAVAALQSPPGRPSVESIFANGVVADVNVPLCGDLPALAAARAFWRGFNESLNDAPPATERTAA